MVLNLITTSRAEFQVWEKTYCDKKKKYGVFRGCLNKHVPKSFISNNGWEATSSKTYSGVYKDETFLERKTSFIGQIQIISFLNYQLYVAAVVQI